MPATLSIIRNSRRFPVAATLLLATLFPTLARTQAAEPVVSTVLSLSGSRPQGGVVLGPDGQLYGASSVTVSGQIGGLIYRVKPDGTSVGTVHQLGEGEGIGPQTGLILASDGFLYGTTHFGITSGLAGPGTVFRVRPDVVLGMGGYISFPGGMMASLLNRPLVVHEQNSVAGLANRVLASVADCILSGFPAVLRKAQWVGNPVRESIVQLPTPGLRFATHRDPLQLLVLGGSLGAQALNEVVPLALKLVPEDRRPQVTHQSGAKHLDALRQSYSEAGISAEAVAFIDDIAAQYARADLVICRAGALTVSELAAAGRAGLDESSGAGGGSRAGYPDLERACGALPLQPGRDRDRDRCGRDALGGGENPATLPEKTTSRPMARRVR
jgi:hypothetical protein